MSQEGRGRLDMKPNKILKQVRVAFCPNELRCCTFCYSVTSNLSWDLLLGGYMTSDAHQAPGIFG